MMRGAPFMGQRPRAPPAPAGAARHQAPNAERARSCQPCVQAVLCFANAGELFARVSVSILPPVPQSELLALSFCVPLLLQKVLFCCVELSLVVFDKSLKAVYTPRKANRAAPTGNLDCPAVVTRTGSGLASASPDRAA